jgi:endonuclease/exonuclease/phosphatase family metal-dependent hydrolase
VPFRVATFNAGLAIGVLPFVTERLPYVLDALAGLDVDLLFVQEFWLDAHWEELRARLRPRMPHAMRPAPVHPATRGCCTQEELAPLVACANARCAGLTDEALAQCVVEHCAGAALALRPPCLNCIASHPVGTFDEIVGRCRGTGAAPDAPPPEAPGRRGFYGDSSLKAYGGSFGTGLLSRTALEDTDLLVFESSVNARGAIHARVVHPDLGDVHVFAAHLSPGGAEQHPQVEELVAWIDAKTGPGEAAPALLLGDLNMTPGSSLFRQLERAGFREANDVDRRGTYASSGLGTGAVHDGGIRIDHVLTRGIAPRSRAVRALDAPVRIRARGRELATTLSDHFAVLATIGGSR